MLDSPSHYGDGTVRADHGIENRAGWGTFLRRGRGPAALGKRKKVEEVEVKTVVLGFLRLMPLLILEWK
jgi:hypothetical protein